MLQRNRLQHLSSIQKGIFHPKSHVYFCLYRLRCVCLPRTWDSLKLQLKSWLVKIYFLEAREMNLWQASITEDSHVLKHQHTEGDVLAGYCHPKPVESTEKTDRLTQEALKAQRNTRGRSTTCKSEVSRREGVNYFHNSGSLLPKRLHKLKF